MECTGFLLSVARLPLVKRSVALRPHLAAGLPLSWAMHFSTSLSSKRSVTRVYVHSSPSTLMRRRGRWRTPSWRNSTPSLANAGSRRTISSSLCYGALASELNFLNACCESSGEDLRGRCPLDLRRFRGLFKTENSARKGEHCHQQTPPTHRSFAEKLSGWSGLPRRNIPCPGSLARSVSPMAPLETG